MRPISPATVAVLLLATTLMAADSPRRMQFRADTPEAARAAQRAVRNKLFALMMGGKEPHRATLDAKILRRIEQPAEGYVLEELTLQTLPDRPRARLDRPANQTHGKGGAWCWPSTAMVVRERRS